MKQATLCDREGLQTPIAEMRPKDFKRDLRGGPAPATSGNEGVMRTLRALVEQMRSTEERDRRRDGGDVYYEPWVQRMIEQFDQELKAAECRENRKDASGQAGVK
ncbi:hypothetical protein QD357_15100 [Rhizobium sp. BR 317]|uniref:hypothetical protein n=1 Tax=Rhizobium sp. BR 317 TaxID=3040015 RepID=UPI0039BF517F